MTPSTKLGAIGSCRDVMTRTYLARTSVCRARAKADATAIFWCENAHGIAAALPLSVLLITTKRIRTLLLTASPGTAANTSTYFFNVSAYDDGPLFLCILLSSITLEERIQKNVWISSFKFICRGITIESQPEASAIVPVGKRKSKSWISRL